MIIRIQIAHSYRITMRNANTHPLFVNRRTGKVWYCTRNASWKKNTIGYLMYVGNKIVTWSYHFFLHTVKLLPKIYLIVKNKSAQTGSYKTKQGQRYAHYQLHTYSCSQDLIAYISTFTKHFKWIIHIYFL